MSLKDVGSKPVRHQATPLKGLMHTAALQQQQQAPERPSHTAAAHAEATPAVPHQLLAGIAQLHDLEELSREGRPQLARGIAGLRVQPGVCNCPAPPH